MTLQQYRAKRNFRKTPEPAAKPGKPHRQPIFIVQEHQATRLHYDFRLEADNVLKSWAVPKGPSMDPAQKRLAVHVEDHPLAYADFKGKIPEGQYGAGTVKLWDKGTFDNLLSEKPVPQTVEEGIEAGRLEFALHGKKLRGRFALIRMNGRAQGKDSWLLIKMKDESARTEHDAGARLARKTRASTAKKTRTPASHLQPSKGRAHDVAFTNLDKLMYPDDGITKGEVIEFYREIAPRLLPFLRDRPATLERLPDGIGNGRTTHFWQKNVPSSYPDWIARAELPTETGKTVNYVLVNNLETLLYLVNQGTLTFHVGFSRVEDIDQPDFVLFDLDPGQATLADAVAVGNELHSILTSERIESFAKTSGKTGLHVLMPWTRTGGFDEARALAEGIAQRVVEALPDQATTARSKAKRGRRVYVDVMQNAKGKHVVPPYVLLPVPGAPVSTPLRWDEVTAELDPIDFTLKTIFRRLAQQKRDPMAGLDRTTSTLERTA
jgi:bifunctional non-homologous end joining protein LigD